MINLTVLTITYRPGYLDTLVEALKQQTFPLNRLQWVLVDELHNMRYQLVENLVGNKFLCTHVPLEPSELSNTAQAVNLGLCHARGELVYFMADYMYLHPRALKRHWYIYQRHGPKCFISGPLLDRFTGQGLCVFNIRTPTFHTVLIGDEPVSYADYSPPIEWPIKSNYLEPTPGNLISVWEKPFAPCWPRGLVLDWRSGMVSDGKICIDDGLVDVSVDPKWWWAGRNDSASLESLLDANGLDESSAGHRAGLDSDLATRMVEQGSRYLFDLLIPCYTLPHPHRKKERSDWIEGEVKLTGNTYNLRERRSHIVCTPS